jgi:hypothetical protein
VQQLDVLQRCRRRHRNRQRRRHVHHRVRYVLKYLGPYE